MSETTWETFCKETPQEFVLKNDDPRPHKPPKKKREKRLDKEFEKKANRASYQLTPATTDEITFRHSNWKIKRALVEIGLKEVGTTPSALERFQECGGDCVIEYCEESKQFRARANYCHNRHCEPCNRAKANLLAANLRDRLQQRPDGRYRFITLTLKHTDRGLRDQIDKLYACFKKLRNTQAWKESQHGGVAILEVKWQPDSRQWHPHLHIIAEGGFLKQSDLSGEWLNCTGDSHIVDIRQLSSGKDAAHYVAKYVSKGTNDAVWTDPEARQEWITAMKGTRTAATYGTWRGFKLLKVNKDEKVWKKIGSLNYIVREAVAGQPWAQGMLSALNSELKYDPHKKRKKAEALPI